jgi:hypothetical protein
LNILSSRAARVVDGAQAVVAVLAGFVLAPAFL